MKIFGHRILPLLILTFVFLVLTATAASAVVKTLPITQQWQHKDTNMLCLPGASMVPHNWDHAVNPAPGCAHCAYYCAPASISMFAMYRGIAGVKIQQDQIYDNGKSTGGELTGDGVLQTHGIGMFDMAPPNGPADEVGAAFTWAIGVPYKWGPASAGFPTLDGVFLNMCIDDNIPVLWCDHFGWPQGIYPPPDEDTFDYNGHAKIIAGYNDNGTAVTNDDLYLIYDPWPVSGSPYWVASGTVVDNKDVYYADYDPVAVESRSWGGVKSLYR